MVRTKEFDEEIVVDRAVRAFLKDSYSSTSVAALEAATGIGRKSIYNTFGSKQALLLRALDKFARESSVKFIEPLEQEGAGRAAIELVVQSMVTRAATKAGRDGCLLCLSAQDPVRSSKLVSRVIDDYFARAHAGFVKCIKTGIRDGDIITSAEPRKLADFFVGLLIGISTMARTGATARAIENYAEVSLGALG